MGVLQRLGIGQPPWDKGEEDYLYSSSTTRPENQLGSGMPIENSFQAKNPSVNEQQSESILEEAMTFTSSEQDQEPIHFQEYEDDYEEANWEEVQQEEIVSQASDNKRQQNKFEEEQVDVWEDTDLDSYTPEPVNIPQKQAEYQEEEA